MPNKHTDVIELHAELFQRLREESKNNNYAVLDSQGILACKSTLNLREVVGTCEVTRENMAILAEFIDDRPTMFRHLASAEDTSTEQAALIREHGFDGECFPKSWLFRLRRGDFEASGDEPSGLSVVRLSEGDQYAQAWAETVSDVFKYDVNAIQQLVTDTVPLDGCGLYFASVDDIPVGTLMIYESVPLQKSAVVFVGTKKEYRRSGVAAALMAHAIDDMLDSTKETWVYSSMMARPLFESLGFELVATHSTWTPKPLLCE